MKVKGFVCCHEGNFYFLVLFGKCCILYDDLAIVSYRNWRYMCKLCRKHFVNLVILVKLMLVE